MLRNLEHDLRRDLEVRIDEHVEGVDHRPGRGILDGHHAVVGPAALHFAEHVLDALHRHVLGRQAELLHARHVRERGARAEVRDFERTLQGKRGGKDLAVNGPEGILGERPLVAGGQAFEDLPFPGGRMEVELLGFFDVADLDDDPGALIQQVDQLIVDLVDLLAKVL